MGNSRMKIRKKWLNQLKNFLNTHFKEYYPTHRRIYLCECFHVRVAMPKFDTVLLNKQN
jgi:hypothetical protein